MVNPDPDKRTLPPFALACFDEAHLVSEENFILLNANLFTKALFFTAAAAENVKVPCAGPLLFDEDGQGP
jgi:hypothetical protein